MKISAIASSVAVDEMTVRLAKEVREYLDEATRYTRALMSDLSPPATARRDIVSGLKWLAIDMQRRGLKTTVRATTSRIDLPPDLQTILFDSVRELLFNVLKHAGTPKANVTVKRASGKIVIQVSDSGVGFGNASTSPEVEARSGFGLLHVAERLKLFGGTMEIDRKRKRGALITISAPTTTQ